MTTPQSENLKPQIDNTAVNLEGVTASGERAALQESEIALALREQGDDKLADILAVGANGEAAAQAINESYPHIAILGDAASYGGDGNEIKRTDKSMINLTRLVNTDNASLGGANEAAIASGLATLRTLTICGLQQFGADRESEGQSVALATGYKRLMGILSIHDLAKSETIAHIAEEKLGCSDHDMAITFLVRDNFKALEGTLSPEQVAALRDVIADPVVREFFEKPRAIVGFNAGRHLQGEAPRNLFVKTVKGVDAAVIAEFIADWSGVNGHTDPFGPVMLANVPAAVNGTASALEKLLEASKASADMGEIYEEFSYPAETLQKLGLERETETGKAVTRVAFMGREHQQKDTEAARQHVACIKEAFDKLPASLREQLVKELNSDDLDLGFTPHSIAELRTKMCQGGAETAAVTTRTYEVFLLTMHRVIEEVRSQKLTQDVITANLSAKVAGTKLADAIDPAAPTAADAVSNMTVTVKKDGQNVIAVDFGVRTNTMSVDNLPAANLGKLAGDNFLVGGIGGGGDIYQAATFAASLKTHGKVVPAVFSIRPGELSKVETQLDNFEIVDREHGILRVYGNTGGTVGGHGRFPERGAARGDESLAVYVILDNDAGMTLSSKIERLARYIEESTGTRIESIVGVDTGGDSLHPMAGGPGDDSQATPDQDHYSLEALSKLGAYNTYSVVTAPGIDSPADFPAVLAKANAEIHMPEREEREAIHTYLTSTGLGKDDSVFSKTSLVCKMINDPEGAPSGYRYVDGISLKSRMNRSNPWKAWVDVQRSMGATCVMTAADHLKAVSENGK